MNAAPRMSLFRTKTIEAGMEGTAGAGEGGLRRVLGVWNLVSLGVGATIGAGIFVMTGSVAAVHAGPAVLVSFLLSGVLCALAGLCYAEFASLIPVAGSAYTYAYATLGELLAWVIGWDLILEYAFSTATVASGWGANFNGLMADLGRPLPASLSTSFNLPAFLAVCGVTALLIVGVRESARVNFFIVVAKVGTILIFVAVAGGFLWKHPEIAWRNWTPFLPENRGRFGEFGWSGVARGAAVIFFAYIGFDAVSTAAQEATDPQRDMPRGLLGSLALCTALYMIVALLLTGVVPYKELNVGAPVALGMDRTGVRWGGMLVRIGTLLGLTTTMLVTLMAQSRVFFAMSRDGLLPGWAGALHPRFRTPWLSLAVVGVVVALFSATVPISVLGELVSIGTLLAFAIVCAGVIVLRKTAPEVRRPFRTPLVPWIPLGGTVAAVALMTSLPLDTWVRLFVWMAIGMAVYFLYSRYHSRLRGCGRKGRGWARSVPVKGESSL